jgi:hypothetical protein
MKSVPCAVLLLLAVLAGLSPAGSALAEETPTAADEARREAVDRLRRDLKKMAAGPYAAAKKDEILKDIEALAVLGGVDGAKAALEALAFEDPDVETQVFSLVETVHDKALVAPLAALVEHRDYRRRFPLHERIAHALAVIGDVSGIETLTTLIGSEQPKVVAASADALSTFRSAPQEKRRDAVKRMIDLYETTWNLKEGVRVQPQQREQARENWEVYSVALRRALQALTGQTGLSFPRQFRDWWNDNKKAKDW